MKVELMYFKPDSGKFYTSGEYDSAFDEAWEVFNEVRGFRDTRRLPGLRAGAVDFDILIDIPDRYPSLIKAVSTVQIKDEISKRIVLARTEKQSAERGGYDRDVLRLDGAIATLESLLEDIAPDNDCDVGYACGGKW